MRIALACHNYPPEFQGGTERVVAALARALVAGGHEVLIVAGSETPHRGRDVELEHYEGTQVLRIPRHPNEVYGLDLRRPRVLTVVEDLLLEHKIEVLHVHHWSTLSIRLVRSARVLGLATGVTLHDMWTTCARFFRRPPHGITCPVEARREECVPCGARDLHASAEQLALGITLRDREIRAELAAAHWITAPSRACAQAIATHLPWRSPIEIVPHGLLEAVAERAAGRSAGAPFRVGTFGNLVREKGVRLLLDAMAGIVGAELHLYGRCLEPGFAAELNSAATRLRVDLRMHGAYDVSNRHPALDLDLAVFPSLCQETYGLVVEEALARGVPVVVSDRGALGERIGQGGAIVPHGDVARLHAVVADIVGDSVRHSALVAGIPREFATIGSAASRYAEQYARAGAGSGDGQHSDVPVDFGSATELQHAFPPLLPKAALAPPVLVLAAHPDDEVIACGGMLAWHAQSGHAVTVVHVTDGANGDPEGRYADIQAVRRREGREALRRLGVTDVRSLGFTDGEVPEACAKLASELARLFTEVGPGTLYSFMPTESHRDHRAVSLATALAAWALPLGCRVLLYGVNQVVSGGTMFDVSAFMDDKQHALAAFASQLAYNDFKLKILHRDHAATVNVEDTTVTHAELFADLRPGELCRMQGIASAYTAFVAGGARR